MCPYMRDKFAIGTVQDGLNVGEQLSFSVSVTSWHLWMVPFTLSPAEATESARGRWHVCRLLSKIGKNIDKGCTPCLFFR
jgi:hypothetical protein